MLLDELLKCASIAAANQLHQPDVIGIFFRSTLVSSIVLRHRDLDVGPRQNLPENAARSSTILVAIVFVATHQRPVHASRAIKQRLPMNYQLIPKELRPIAENVEAEQRISEADALTLYATNDLNALGMMANVVRERKNGNYATYIHNRYINYSNICILSCQFCAFAARKRDAHAFEYAIDEIARAVADALPLGVTEVHMVGGLHPTLKKDWYLDLLRRLRALDPQLHIKAFTAIEVRHLAQRVFKSPIRDTLETLRQAGLGSITGGDRAKSGLSQSFQCIANRTFRSEEHTSELQSHVNIVCRLLLEKKKKTKSHNTHPSGTIEFSNLEGLPHNNVHN